MVVRIYASVSGGRAMHVPTGLTIILVPLALNPESSGKGQRTV
jgi:hypothetical protein